MAWPSERAGPQAARPPGKETRGMSLWRAQMNGLAVSLRGRARYSAQRRSSFLAGVNEGGTTQALLRPLGRERLLLFLRREET